MGALFVAGVQAQDQKAPSEGRRGRGGQEQGGRGQMPSPEARVEQLDKALSLTDEQKTKIKEIYTKAGEEMRAAMKEGGGDREAARGKMMERMRATRDQVRAVLTDEQKKKFDEMPQRGGGDQGGRSRGGKRGENK